MSRGSLHDETGSESVVAVTSGKRAAWDKTLVGLAGSVHSDESGTTGEGTEDSLEGNVMESGEEVSTTHTMLVGLGALEGIHEGIVTALVGVVEFKGAVGLGDTDQGAVVVELEKVTLTEAVNNGDHGELVGLEVESLVDRVIRDLEREWVESTIGDDFNVLQTTVVIGG